VEQILAFLGDAANWQNETGVPNRLAEHIAISLLAVLTASLIALPLGFYIGHTGRLQLLGINIANIGRAVPSYAVMVMLLPVMLGLAPVLGYDPRLGLRFLPIFLAMVLLAIPPILVAAYAGLQAVDRDLTESSRGMGLTETQILTRVELPLALPTIIAGLRIATVSTVALVTVGVVVGHGGLGQLLFAGFNNNLYRAEIFTATALCVVLALVADALLLGVERLLTPWSRR
jgi:osmoprotectant transport system permease protein